MKVTPEDLQRALDVCPKCGNKIAHGAPVELLESVDGQIYRHHSKCAPKKEKESGYKLGCGDGPMPI